MVNEETEITDGIMRAGANEFYKFQVLQRRFNFMEALEDYIKKHKQNNNYVGSHFVESRLITYFFEAGIFLQKSLKSKLDEYEKLKDLVFKAASLKDYYDFAFTMDKYLYEFNFLSIESDYIGKFSKSLFDRKPNRGTIEEFER